MPLSIDLLTTSSLSFSPVLFFLLEGIARLVFFIFFLFLIICCSHESSDLNYALIGYYNFYELLYKIDNLLIHNKGG